jgi:uncharacterized protein involved in exopolysaccharide biosynthesis
MWLNSGMGEIEEEISFSFYWNTLKRYKIIILVFIVLSVGLCSIYNRVATKQYRSYSTFFVPLQNSGGGSSILGYARALGVGLPSNLGDYLVSILQSRRIHESIAIDLRLFFPNMKDSVILGKLQLGKNTKINKSSRGIFSLSYFHKNPEVSFAVINSYLNNLSKLNKELEMTVQKQIITVLDPPLVAKGYFKPNKRLNLALSGILSLFFSIIFVFLYDQILKPKKK